MKKINKTININQISVVSWCLALMGLLHLSCVDDDTPEFGIADEPVAAIGFENTNVDATEGTQTATFEINASKPLFEDVSFDLTVISGDDSEVTLLDAEGNNNNSFTIKAGEDKAIIAVTVANNSIFSGDRTITYGLTNLSGAGVFLAEEAIGSGDDKISPEFTLTIIEDEPAPLSINFSETASSIDENAGIAQQITIALTEPARASGSFNVIFSGTAVEGTDYTSNATAGTLSINVNANDTEFTIDVTPVDNSDATVDRTVILTITNPSDGLIVGTNNVHTLTIVEDDLPTVTIDAEADAELRAGDKGDDTGGDKTNQSISNGTDARGRDERHIIMKFDVSGIDLNKVVSATLIMTTNPDTRSWIDAETFFGGATTQKVYHVTGGDNWEEATVTWNNAPSFTLSPIATGNFALVGDSKVTHEFDVTNSLIADNDGTFSLRLGTDDDTDGEKLFYGSKENQAAGTGTVPQLVIISNP